MIRQKRSRTSTFNSPSHYSFSYDGGNAANLKLESLFQPDILISSQYQATYRRRFHLEPERVLMLAILEDAIVCFQDNLGATCKRKKTLHSDAEEWILDDDKSYFFSFENICSALGFDPGYLRHGLIRWKEAALAKHCTKESRRQLAS